MKLSERGEDNLQDEKIKKKGYCRGKHQQPLQIQGKCNWLEGNLNW